MRGFRYGPLSAVVVSLLLAGCATNELVIYNARKRVQFTSNVVPTAAALLGDNLYLQLRMDDLAKEEHHPQEYFVELSLNPEEWPRDEAAGPLGVHDDLRLSADLRLRLVPTSSFRSMADWPANAGAVEIIDFVAKDNKTLARSLAEAGPGIKVFSVTLDLDRSSYSIPYVYGDADDPSRTILLVVGAPKLNKEPVAFDFYSGYDRQWGWYALAPLTVAFDIITAPIQLVIILLSENE